MKNKGFTLVELLVVISIIGMMSSIVLSSLNSARNKGKDSAVKQNLASMRAAGEISYTNNGNFNLTCADTAKPFAVAQANGSGGANPGACTNSAASWAAYVPLNQQNLVNSGSGIDFWCVDSRGFSVLEDALSGAITQCP